MISDEFWQRVMENAVHDKGKQTRHSSSEALSPYIRGSLQSIFLYKLAHQVLLLAQGKFLSLKAVYILGYINQGANILLR